jgi:hypothetical protein
MWLCAKRQSVTLEWGRITAHIPFLRPDVRIIGQAYLTDDEEIVFTPHRGTIEVDLVAPESGTSGP